MKIHSTHQNVSGQGRRAYRLLAFCGAAALCVTLSTSAEAQSHLPSDLITSPVTEIESAAGVRNGLFTHGSENYRVVRPAAFRTAADIGTTEPGSIAQVGFHACDSCGTGCGGTCGGFSACGSCGTDCGGSCRYKFDACAPCDPFYYASAEALYMKRDGLDRYSLSPNFRMSEFDYEYAGRATIGTVPDCVHGYEVSYAGRLQWDRFGLANSFIGGIQTAIVPGSPLVAANFSAFQDADFQTQAYQAEYWSVEANKTTVGWDIAKVLVGLRYIDYQEEFNYFSRDGLETGSLRSAVENKLFGLQVGLDLLYPIGRHAYTDFRSRLGGFINAAENEFTVFNAGFPQVLNGDDRTDIAGMLELGGGVRYQVGPALSIRAGAELWYLANIATAPDQFPGAVIFPSTGNRTRIKDDFVITGLSVGATLRF